MMMNDPTEGVITRISEWVINMALLNLYWVIFTLAGGIVFGWAPALAALMTVQKRQLQDRERFPVFKAMAMEFRKNFLKANGIGAVLALAALLLVFYSFTLTQWDGFLMLVFFAAFLVIAIVVTMVTIFIFPVFVYYDQSFLGYFKYALIVGISHFHYVLMLAVTLAVIGWGYAFFPGALLAFGASFPAMCAMHLSLKVFTKIQQKQELYAAME